MGFALVLLAQLALPPSVPGDICATVEALIDLDLRIGGACRLSGEPVRDARAGDLPFASLHIDGFDERALGDLRAGLDAFVRVATPLAEIFARGAIGSALDDFDDALQREPRLTEAAIAAAGLALRTRLEDDLRRALAICARAADAHRVAPHIAELHIALGEADRVDPGSLGADTAGLRAAALALLLRDDSRARARGDSLYFEAARASAGGLRRAIRDVEALVTDVDIEDAADLEALWDALSAEAAVPRPARLHTHFQRMREAYRRFYDWPRRPTRAGLEDVPLHFDARGVIYIRHGEPDRRIVSNGELDPTDRGRMPPVYESWLYDRGWTGGYAVHFVGQNRDWHFQPFVPGCDEDWLATRAELDARIGGILVACMRRDLGTAGSIVAEVGREIREQLAAATASQSVDLGLRELLAARGSIHRLRDTNGADELLVVAGIPVEPGITDTLGVGASFTLRMDAFLASGAGGSRATDSLSTRTTAVREPGYAALAVLLPAPDAAGLARIVLRDVDSTQVGAALSIAVPAARRTTLLAMSDVVLLSLDAPPTLERHGLGLAPMPDVAGRGRFGVYFELYDLPPEAERYVATIRARKPDAGLMDRMLGRDGEISLRFEGRPNRVAQGVAAELLEVATPDWEPGEYEFEIEVQVGAERVVRTRRLLVE